MIVGHVVGLIQERKTEVAKSGVQEITRIIIRGRVHQVVADTSQESNCRIIKFSREVISELRKHSWIALRLD